MHENPVLELERLIPVVPPVTRQNEAVEFDIPVPELSTKLLLIEPVAIFTAVPGQFFTMHRVTNTRPEEPPTTPLFDVPLFPSTTRFLTLCADVVLAHVIIEIDVTEPAEITGIVPRSPRVV